MQQLSTIQKREKLNKVYVRDEKGPGGAHHAYEIVEEVPSIPDGYFETMSISIQFQKGPRKELNSVHGIIDSDLLEIVRHRLQCFQAGEYATRENEMALTHIEEALMWLNRRVEDRIERNVLGMNKK